MEGTTSNNGLNAVRGIITREAMLEYLNLQRWSRQLCASIPLTLGLWLTLLALVSYRAHTEASFSIRQALTKHITDVTADMSKGASPSSLPTDSTMTEDPRCTCACAPVGFDLCQPGLPTVASFNGSLAIEKLQYLHARSQYFEGPVADLKPMKWDNLQTIDDVWYWVQHGFIADLWHEVPASVPVEVGSIFGAEASLGVPLQPPGRVLRFNQILGGVRLRQRRTEVEECNGDPRITALLRQTCHSSEPLTKAFGPAAMGEGLYAEGFLPESEERGAFDVYLDIGRPVYEVYETLKHSLENLGWLDDATSELLLQAAFLNGEAEPALYGFVEVHFVFEKSGALRSHIRVSTSAAKDYPGPLYVALDATWFSLVFLLLAVSMHKAIRRWRGKRQPADFWTAVDWFAILVSLCIVAGRLLISLDSSKVADRVSKLPSSPPAFSAELVERQAYQAAWALILDNIIHINLWMEYYRLALFVYSVVLTFEIFKVFRGQPKLQLLAVTMRHAAEDVLHFIVMFFILFLSFAFSGYLIYGLRLQHWSTTTRAINTCFRSLIGDTDLPAMYEVAPVSTLVWYFLFLTVMIFMMLNLLLAITYDHYSLVKRRCGQTAGISLQASLTLRDIRRRLAGTGCLNFCCRCRRSSDIPEHAQLMQELMDLSNVPQDEQGSSNNSVLGLRMHWKEKNLRALDQGKANKDPILRQLRRPVDKDLKKMHLNADYLSHLLDECAAQAKRESGRKEIQVAQMQELVVMAEDLIVAMRQRIESCQLSTKTVMYEFMWRLEVLERKVHSSLADLVHIANCAGIADAKPAQTIAQRAKLDSTVGALRSLSPEARTDALLEGSVHRVLDHLGQTNAASSTSQAAGAGPESPKNTIQDWHRAMRRVDMRAKRAGPGAR